jgi:biotin transport system substrate-specific component
LLPVTVIALPRQRVLADVVPGGLARDAVLVLGGTGLIALSALFSFHVPWTPVPFTLQTCAVLLVGASLGAVRGGLSSLVYLLVGMAGVPWFSGHTSGWDFASFGYLVGFVVAAALVGWLAERGGDRTAVRAAGTMVLGNLVIYAIGVTYLMASVHVSLAAALALGFTPFVLGDLVKVALAAGLLPAAWRLVHHVESR